VPRLARDLCKRELFQSHRVAIPGETFTKQQLRKQVQERCYVIRFGKKWVVKRAGNNVGVNGHGKRVSRAREMQDGMGVPSSSPIQSHVPAMCVGCGADAVMLLQSSLKKS
jgi:hypothetical protein